MLTHTGSVVTVHGIDRASNDIAAAKHDEKKLAESLEAFILDRFSVGGTTKFSYTWDVHHDNLSTGLQNAAIRLLDTMLPQVTDKLEVRTRHVISTAAIKTP